ncbi:hypothetical protein [Mycolicibacterium setense]|uniref:hypothetical protein n=1 Tax=Mycolicibacterium setense TaxID=431269 RepID=UPI00103951F5|nr:hypothetical protein [Mycolicibacterium setense]MCV7110617.1 hypothetical protein [Mycolicibacterium setense]
MAMLSDALGAALSGGIASGRLDAAGLDFGQSYGELAKEFATGLANAANAFKVQGYKLEATGVNYKNADAASTVGGPGPTGGVGDAPEVTNPAGIHIGPNSAIVPPPALFYMFQGTWAWPSGNPALMRLTAAQWRNFAAGFAVLEQDLATVQDAVAGLQIPERARISEVLSNVRLGFSELTGKTSDIATKVEAFADVVQEAQAAIRRLLDRFSLSGLVDTVKGLLRGDGEKLFWEIFNDIGAVLKNLQRQVKGFVNGLTRLTNEIGDAVERLQKWVEPRLEEVFGDKVGGALAEVFKTYTDFQVGVLTGVIGTVAGTVAMLDPDTWIGMYEVGMSVVEDPSTLDDVLVAMGKEFVAWDKWSGDHPGRAAGEAGFNILSSFGPSGPLSKTGLAAKGLKAAKGAMEADGKLSKLGDLAKMGSGKGKLDGLDSPGSPKAPEVPEFAPAPGVPESVIGPKAPNDFGGTPGRPGLEASAGSPESSSPRGHHGGGGDDPPDPPGRATGPSESGPSQSAGPSPQSPTSGGLGHPADPPHSPGPSTPSHTPASGDPVTPNINHVPETSSPAHTPDSGQSHPGNGQTPTSHEPSTPETHNNGQMADGQGHNSGVREDAGQGPVGNHSPSETNVSGPDERNGPSDQRVHTPTEHQPAHEPATPTSGHERGTPEGGNRQAEQPRLTHDGTTVRHEPGPATPVGVFAGGIPPAPHIPGTGHSAGDGSPASGKTPAPEPASRNPESKAPQGSSPETPRRQPTDAAAGPAPRSTPHAPVGAAGHGEAPAPSRMEHREVEERRPADLLHETRSPADGDSPGDAPAHSAPGAPDVGEPGDFASSHPPLHRENPYPPKYMSPKYWAETQANHPQNPFGGRSVERWTPEKLEEHRVVVDQNGSLRHIDGRLVDTQNARTAWTPQGGRAIFIMDPHGNFYLSHEHAPGKIHHSTLGNGNPVGGAGEIAVVDGRVVELTDDSGHYRPLRSNTKSVLDELAGRGVDVGSISIRLSAPEGT